MNGGKVFDCGQGEHRQLYTINCFCASRAVQLLDLGNWHVHVDHIDPEETREKPRPPDTPRDLGAQLTPF